MTAATAEMLPTLAWLSRQPQAAGLTLTVRVGPVCVRLTGLPAGQHAILRARYGVFCVDQPEAEAQIGVTITERDGFLLQQRPGEIYRIHSVWESGSLVATSYEWAGWIGPERSGGVTGGLVFAAGRAADAGAFDRSLENYLRVLFAHLVLRRGGFLLHGSGLVREGKAYLFFGPSGSGKTTVTTLTPEALVLSDDLVMVLRGSAGGFEACSVPFRGQLAPDPISAGSWPIAGFFRLVQAPQDRLSRVRGAAAMGELSTSLPFVLDRAEGASEAMGTLAEVASRVPVFRLEFRKDRTFWQLIRPDIDDFSEVGGINS
jgi:hypothetical protein